MTDSRPAQREAGQLPAASPARRRRGFVLAAAALVAGIGASAALVEVGVRLFCQVTDIPFFFWDPLLGPRRAPRQSGRYVYGQGHIDARYRFNDQGWNHPDASYATRKPPGSTRVCMIGDSYVEALQVDVGRAMFSVAAEAMTRPDRPVEWLAFGCSGWGTSQEYEVIRHYALEYSPDVVILLFVQNDPYDCSPYVAPQEAFSPAYLLDESDRLELLFAEPYTPSRFRRWSSMSAAVRYFMVQKDMVGRINRLRHGTHTVRGIGGAPRREQIAGLENRRVPGLEALSLPQREQRTWLLVEKLLEAARDECRRRGAVFAVAFRGFAARIEAPLTGESIVVPPREDDPWCLHERASEMGPEQVAPICDRLDIPYLDLTDALTEMVRTTRRSHVFPDDGHYSPAAHEASGRALAAWVDSLLTTRVVDRR